MNGVIARIVLRYAAGALVAKGLLSADVGATLVGDVDVQGILEIALGGCASLAVEGWYALAKRFGWST